MSLKWEGEALRAKLDRASKSGVNTTMAACILHAKANHGPGAHGAQRFESQRGKLSSAANLERSVRIVKQARRVGRAVVGRWGSIGANYAKRIEFGFQGQDALGRTVNAPAYPFLFPAARAEYPKLAKRIKAAL